MNEMDLGQMLAAIFGDEAPKEKKKDITDEQYKRLFGLMDKATKVEKLEELIPLVDELQEWHGATDDNPHDYEGLCHYMAKTGDLIAFIGLCKFGNDQYEAWAQTLS